MVELRVERSGLVALGSMVYPPAARLSSLEVGHTASGLRILTPPLQSSHFHWSQNSLCAW